MSALLSATTDAAAGALFQSSAQAAGLDVSHLGGLAQVQLALAEVFTATPPGAISAGDIAAGTFGADIGSTGTYTFPTQVNFGTKVVSTTALATPTALAATALNAFASTVSGATLMGFGTTGDVTLKNRAGTDVLVVTANTTGVTLAGILGVTGLVTATAGVTSAAGAALKSGTAVPATAGAVAAGAPITIYSSVLTIEATSDAPTHTRPKGSLCINTGGGSIATRLYVNTDGAGTWANFVSSA